MSDVLIPVKDYVLFDIKFEWVKSLKFISLMNTCRRVVSLKGGDNEIITNIKRFIESVDLLTKYETVRLLDNEVSENLLMIDASEICSLFTTNIESVKESMTSIDSIMEKILSHYITDRFESRPDDTLYDKFVKYLNFTPNRREFTVMDNIIRISDKVDKFELYKFGTTSKWTYCGMVTYTPIVTISSLILSQHHSVDDIISYISKLMYYQHYMESEIEVMTYNLVAMLFVRECCKYASINNLRDMVTASDQIQDYFREFVIDVLNRC